MYFRGAEKNQLCGKILFFSPQAYILAENDKKNIIMQPSIYGVIVFFCYVMVTELLPSQYF